ncbi:MAG: glycoside hydrolase family 1 protein [bacterium]
MSDRAKEFPKDFLWGTAVCSHQAEGHNVNSDWWAWEQEGKIDDGTVSGPASDMLNRYPEDFELMESLGYNSFRLSVEWARIEPERGKYSEEALAHYENVMKEMRKRNIKVCLTLYHWVLPKWMADSGGWTNSNSIRWFREYVRRVVYRLYDYVDIWCTLNEPMVPVLASYVGGVFPPEKKNPILAGMVFRNLLRAHSAAAGLIRDAAAARRDSDDPKIGIAMALADVQPVNPDNILDRKLHELMGYFHNEAFLQAMHTGKPFGVGATIPGLKGSFTYIGANYYTRFRLDILQGKKIDRLEDLLYLPEGAETTEMGYEVYPTGFYNVLKSISAYGVPIYVTENGIADSTDEKRPGYILRHLNQVHRAISDGIDVRGYFYWTYIDNFEWKYGFSKKFGLVAMEPGTLNRLPRRSAYLYGKIAKAGKLTPEMAREYAPDVESELWGCADGCV